MNRKISNLLGVGFILFLSLFLLPEPTLAATEVSGSILSDTVWTLEDSPYVVNGTLSIPEGIELSIDPGVVVKFMHNNQSRMDVYGTLLANGSAEDNIYFTSYKDDEVGGDTNGDGDATLPAGKDWRQVIVYPGANANFEFTVIRYGGNTAFSCPNYSCLGAVNNRGNLIFSNSQIYQTDKYGIYQTEGTTNVDSSVINNNSQSGINVDSGSLTVVNSTISNQTHTGIVVSNNSDFILNGNIFQNNLRDVYINATVNFVHENNVSDNGGFHIAGVTGLDAVWTSDDMPYIAEGSVIVPIGKSLNIEPGVVVKFSHNQSQMEVRGVLNINGTEESKVYFTSLKDDEVAGDTNGDGDATSPAESDWRRILINPGAEAAIENLVIKYGGYRQFSCPNRTCNGAINNRGTLDLLNSEISDNYGYGVYQNEGNTLIVGSSILNNGDYGVYNYTGNTIEAVNNWWGDASGPYHYSLNPDGLGDAVSDNVNFEPWREQENPSEIDPLILQYEPILYFHENERFFPMNVEAFVENSSLWRLNGTHELIKEESDIDPVTLEDLTPLGQETVDYYLQFSEDLNDKEPDPDKANTEYSELLANEGALNTYYAYKMEDSYEDDEGVLHEFIVLQYWYFYAMNDWDYHGGFNNHEGDWEVVMVFLDKDTEEPKYVAYSAHHNKGEANITGASYDSVRRAWGGDEINKENNQVISFVAVGSHANYPNNGYGGEHEIPILPNDKTSYDGEHWYEENWQERFVFDENNFPLWLRDYEGKWGVIYEDAILPGSDGPQGPYYRGGDYSIFNNPIKWAGVDNISEINVTEIAIDTYAFLKQRTKFVFDDFLEVGTKLAVDLHNEVISFGENASDTIFAPHFWDIESSLENNTFGVEVSFEYDKEELVDLGIDEDNLSAYYYNEAVNAWEVTPSVIDVNNSTVSFFTNHFSRYAIGTEIWQDVSESMGVKNMWDYYKTQTGIKEINIKLENMGEESVSGDLRLLITDFDKEGIELFNLSGITEEGIPYIDIGQPYNHCVFVGIEQDIPETAEKWWKNIMLAGEPIYKYTCDDIIKKYPGLEDKLEYVLVPGSQTKTIKLEFKLPIKETQVFETYDGEERTSYIPEFKDFDFEVGVLVGN